MYRMNGYEIEEMIWGATLLGGGGGGAIESGLNGLQQYMEDHGILDKADVMVQVYETGDMDPEGYAACTAAMGAPTKFKEVRIAPYIKNSFKQLRVLADRMRREIKYSISVEIGGFNTFVPLLVAMEMGIPFIDADGAGRAVPALDTLLLNVNGLPTSPLAMADDKGNRVSIELESAMDAPMGEAIGRNICVGLGQLGGLSGWMLKKDEIEKNIPVGSVKLCQQVGRVFKTAQGTDMFEALKKEIPGIQCVKLCSGKVIETQNAQEKGFDKGVVKIQDGQGDIWASYFLNENLVVTKNDQPVMTVPDIICYYNPKTNTPLSNADIVDKNGKPLVEEVTIGAVKVDPKWWNNGEAYVQKIWNYYFDILGFNGQKLIKYPPQV